MQPWRLVRRATAPTLAGLLVMACVAGWGHPAGLPVGDVQQPDAARAVRQLTGGPVSATIPADFARVMGYEPVLSHGRLVRPDGSCSSPFGPTGYGFGDSCRAHDLGYDLLRYAERKGHPLGHWARRAVDDEFDRSLHSRCTGQEATRACHAAAGFYADAVRLNTWRQGFGVPVTEGPGLTLLGVGVGLVVALLIAGSAAAAPRPATSRRHGRVVGRVLLAGATR